MATTEADWPLESLTHTPAAWGAPRGKGREDCSWSWACTLVFCTEAVAQLQLHKFMGGWG